MTNHFFRRPTDILGGPRGQNVPPQAAASSAVGRRFRCEKSALYFGNRFALYRRGVSRAVQCIALALCRLSNQKFTCRNCGGGDRGRVAIYRPFGEVSLSLNRTVTCMVLKANDRRTSLPLPR
ncbi:uncharacterized protein TNCV_3119291 [Trichonephila clavipes]|uniref:Uncharacterized protein n=1 Tax=Trichonephila clavipes TaxID=2585209 RepID=A0A8X7BHL0_TRICX|nr:uncharacterized protein TNCV_3119291 [Trichonephila clavipes]